MSIKDDSIVGSILKILKDRPDIVLMLIVVGGFLYYIDRKEERDIEQHDREAARLDLVAEQRIKVCHDIQHSAVEAMKANTEALRLHSEADARLSEDVETLTITVSGHTTALHSLEMSMQQLLEAVGAHRGLAFNEVRRDEE